MATEIFTKQQFEAALPCDKETGERLWHETSIGIEYTYAIPVPDVNDAHATILVQSSIRRGKQECDGTGENSIRTWLVNPHDFREPLAGKLQRWTARTKNWRSSLDRQLRELWKIGLMLGPCPNCGKPIKVKTSHSEKNPDRQFAACDTRNCYFGGWLDEEIQGYAAGR